MSSWKHKWLSLLRRVFRTCYSPRVKTRRQKDGWLILTDDEEEEEEEGSNVVQFDPFINDAFRGEDEGGGVVYVSSVFGEPPQKKKTSSNQALLAAVPARQQSQLVKIADGPVEGTQIVQNVDKCKIERLYKMLGEEDENAEAIKTALHELLEAEKASRLESILSSLQPELLRTVEHRYKNEAKLREALSATNMLQHTNTFMGNILRPPKKNDQIQKNEPYYTSDEEEEKELNEEEEEEQKRTVTSPLLA